MEKFFKLKEHNTTVRTEIIAGATTFMTMAYILIVNPLMLADTGMPFGAVFTATALSSLIATLIMGLYANLPFALAPGMGLNAFFTYAVVLGMGKTWQFALTAVFLEGIIFIILTFLNIREAIIDSIPMNVKRAISVGIGLFIAFIGLVNSGIIVHQDYSTIIQLGEITSGPALLALIGLMITGFLLAKGVKGALLIGILVTTVIGVPMGITTLFEGFKLVSAPPSMAETFFKFDFSNIFSFDMFVILFTFLMVDMFDTVGTLIGVATKADMLTEDGKIPNAKQALFADAVGTTIGAIFGTSTVTTYVESSAGVAEGGRTGLTSVVTAALFAVALFFSNVFLLIPSAATAPALILVGLFMMSPIKEIDFADFTESIPAFITIIFMPLTYSISEGIVFGMLSYIILKVLTGKGNQISVLTYIVGLLFIGKILL
ncbi:MAG: NCS2 family permease [Tissierellales bacterium]|nr:NCS2 family permease [Tissierellales bacterium]MBN2828032.1 NCS2 family permease [Tissierellales bacterium]